MSAFNFEIEIREFERGWGDKRIDTEEFETYEAACAATDEINSKNTSRTAPDYYIQAAPLNFSIKS